MTRRIAFHTLGCKLNQFETEALATEFKQAGYRIVEAEEEADCYIVNTCTVTGKADRKSRNSVNRALRAADGRPNTVVGRAAPAAGPDRLVVVTGCFAEDHREELERSGVTYVVDNDRKRKVFELVDAHFRGEVVHPNQLERDLFSYTVSTNVFRTRAMLKVQDGCDNFCSFCIIPRVRGHAVSRPIEDILENLRAIVETGYREVVLTGVNMTRYHDRSLPFSGMLERVLETPGDFRVRVSSIEPDSLDERFFALLRHPKFCPHLHLCLQSGSERILLQMRRQYTAREYRRIVERIRSASPLFNFTTDVIVGFPGETPEDFEKTARICSELEFSHIHTFPYSRRSGTRAARSSEQISEAAKKVRAERIREISQHNQRRFRRHFIGQTQHVLIERVTGLGNGGLMGYGYGQHYVPAAVSSNGSGVPKGARLRPNRFVEALISGMRSKGEPVLEAVRLGESAVPLPELTTAGPQSPVFREW